MWIGYSISISNTVPVWKWLDGKANVHHARENCGPTSHGLAKLPVWLGNEKWDVMQFNWGWQDLKIVADGQWLVWPEVYEKNMRELVRQLKATGPN